jgi:hypothetical protein
MQTGEREVGRRFYLDWLKRYLAAQGSAILKYGGR